MDTALNQSGLDVWAVLAKKGIANAIRGLSQMVGREIVTTSLGVKRVLIKEAAEALGGADACTVAICLTVGGDASGHLFIAYRPKTAFALVDLLLEGNLGDTAALGDMERSALGEVGNIMGSFFMNSLADASGLRLLVSPPAVMMDMAGSVLDPLLADLMLRADDALVVEAAFGTRDRQVDGTFLVLPSPDLQETVLRQRATS